MAKKLTPEKLQKLMQIAENQASSVSDDYEGAVNGKEVYLETLADEINNFFGLVKEIKCPDCGGVDSHNEDCWINHITAARA